MSAQVYNYYRNKLETLEKSLIENAIELYAKNQELTVQEAAQDCRAFWQKIFPAKLWPCVGKYKGVPTLWQPNSNPSPKPEIAK